MRYPSLRKQQENPMFFTLPLSQALARAVQNHPSGEGWSELIGAIQCENGLFEQDGKQRQLSPTWQAAVNQLRATVAQLQQCAVSGEPMLAPLPLPSITWRAPTEKAARVYVAQHPLPRPMNEEQRHQWAKEASLFLQETTGYSVVCVPRPEAMCADGVWEFMLVLNDRLTQDDRHRFTMPRPMAILPSSPRRRWWQRRPKPAVLFEQEQDMRHHVQMYLQAHPLPEAPEWTAWGRQTQTRLQQVMMRTLGVQTASTDDGCLVTVWDPAQPTLRVRQGVARSTPSAA